MTEIDAVYLVTKNLETSCLSVQDERVAVYFGAGAKAAAIEHAGRIGGSVVSGAMEFRFSDSIHRATDKETPPWRMSDVPGAGLTG